MKDALASRKSAFSMSSYQSMRRLVLAVLVIVLLAALLFGQSLFAPETPIHEGIEMIAVCGRKNIADDSVFRQQAMDQASGKQVEEQAKKYLEQIKSRAIIQVRR